MIIKNVVFGRKNGQNHTITLVMEDYSVRQLIVGLGLGAKDMSVKAIREHLINKDYVDVQEHLFEVLEREHRVIDDTKRVAISILHESLNNKMLPRFIKYTIQRAIEVLRSKLCQ